MVHKFFILCFIVVFGSINAGKTSKHVSCEQQSIQDDTCTAVRQDCNLSYQVRVLLSEHFIEENNWDWTIESEDGFFLTDSVKADNRWQSSLTKLKISFQDGFFYINNKRILKKQFVFRPKNGHLIFEDASYQGNFIVMADNKRCYLINMLDLEDYVYSVLRTEGWPGWPHEMNKVLAITCRTYVIAMIKEAKECKRAYDVKNTNEHQTYKGVHTQHVLKRAVEDTKGVFISHNNQPIIAMFDICCGGVIPAGIASFNFERAPYLARDYACTYCKDCSSYSWKLSFDKQELVSYLQKEYPQLTTLRDFKITKKDKAGLVLEAIIKGSKTVLSMTGRKLYSTFKGIKSYCFGISKKGNTITFNGRGFGHHLGLCQWGARAMVRDGWNYRSILSFYYPQTKLMRLL